jgi:hypothetical protein
MKFTIEMNVHELSRSIAAGTLESLVNDIKSHEDQVRSEKAAQTKPAPVAAPAPEAPIAVEPTPTPAPSEPEITEVKLRAKFVELNKKGKKKELKALLDKLGVAKVSDIQPEQYEEAWAGLEAL